MKTTLTVLGVLALLSVSTANASTERNPLCKASYNPTEQQFNFQNFDLGQKGEYNYKTGCIDLFVKMIKKIALPKVGGVVVPAHLVYELPQDDVFPIINRLLAAHRTGTMRLEIGFSIPGLRPLADDMTSIDVLIKPLP